MFFHDLLKRLADNDIAYCVVGGVAVNLHGVPRMTYDIDLAVELASENLRAIELTLTGLGLSCQQPVSLEDFSDPSYREELKEKKNMMAVTFTDPSNPIREVDLLISTVIPFSELIERAVKLDLDDVPVWLVSSKDLIEMKRASERAQDQDDVRLLEQILEMDDEDASGKGR